MPDDYTLLDLIKPDIREVMETHKLLNNRETIQQHLAESSRHMIDAIHVLLCRSDGCVYYEEESFESTWTLPAHVEYTDITLILMNLCGFGPGQFITVLGKYLKATEALGGPGPAHNLFQHLYSAPEEFLASLKLTTIPDLELSSWPAS